MRNVSVTRFVSSTAVVVAVGLLLPAGRADVDAQRFSVASLHKDAIVVDGHEHTINRVYWEGIDPWKVQPAGVWDYARAKQGGLDVVIEQLRLEDRYTNYNYTVKQATRLIETFYRVLEANRDKMELALNTADVRRIARSGRLAVILGLEGGFDMEGDLDVLRLFQRLGVRLVQFVNHNTTNSYADAAAGEQKWGGITDRGREIIREMNRLGVVISIAHSSDKAQLQIIDASAVPVAASHFGLRHFSDNRRTLTDDALKALTANGGLVGIHSSGSYLSQKYVDWVRSRQRPDSERELLVVDDERAQRPPQDYGDYIGALDAFMREGQRRVYSRPWREHQQAMIDAGAPLPTIEDWMNQVDYAVNLVGEDHVGIGLDANGPGSGDIRDFDATKYPLLTEAMVARRYSPTRIRKILGENWLRLLDKIQAGAAVNR